MAFYRPTHETSGNAILLNGVIVVANREIGVPSVFGAKQYDVAASPEGRDDCEKSRKAAACAGRLRREGPASAAGAAVGPYPCESAKSFASTVDCMPFGNPASSLRSRTNSHRRRSPGASRVSARQPEASPATPQYQQYSRGISRNACYPRYQFDRRLLPLPQAAPCWSFS